jgi:hypothetical protein
VVNRSSVLLPLASAAILALLGPSVGRAGPAEERSAAQAELAAIAPRIEQLKREAAAGNGRDAELLSLLGRAQALAALLERTSAHPPLPGASPGRPDAQELRERADAVRDRADKQAAALAAVERRLAELSRRAELAERVDAFGAAADLFGDGVTTRPAAGAPRGGDGSSIGATPGGGPAVPGVAAGLQASLRASSEPGHANVAAGAEDAGSLQRRRSDLVRSIAALRAEADALDAEARSAEGR